MSGHPDSEIDGAGEVRAEDAFDIRSMHAWLGERIDGLGHALPRVRQFSGGASNLTYLVRYQDRDLILRRPPSGRKAASAHDMSREFDIQRKLAGHFPYVATMVALCADEDVIGSEFYLMERVPGVILRGNLPRGLELAPEQARSLSCRAVDALVRLHTTDVEAAGLESLGKGPGYVERQVSGWSRRYTGARTDNVASFERVINWLRDNQPDDVATAIIHNDFRLDNLVLSPEDPTRIVAVLDWEMATVGDPLMDLGGALAYWVQADDDKVMRQSRRQPTDLPGMLTRREVFEYYCQAMGFVGAEWKFYEVFGLFRLAGIIQQIYYRYHHGQTTNPAFRDFWMFANYLDWRCQTLAGIA